MTIWATCVGKRKAKIFLGKQAMTPLDCTICLGWPEMIVCSTITLQHTKLVQTEPKKFVQSILKE